MITPDINTLALAKAREILDRWWEEVNEEALMSLEPKYLNYLAGRTELTRLVRDEMVPHVANALARQQAVVETVRVDLEYIEDLLGFHEGSEDVISPGGEPVIWINANGEDGDFQSILRRVRAGLKALAALDTPPEGDG